ncbi:hypothetical protein HYX07_04665 [Candidatus Woesearchaeota archaeon]|nr:hypothetical protein [Candidatus Woesearchaeota archaeon]
MSKKSLLFSLVLISFIISGCTAKVEQQEATQIPEIKESIEQEQNDYDTAQQSDILEERDIEHGKESSQQSGWSVLHTKLDGCQEKDVVFTSLPLDIEDITAVEPQGELTNSGHVTPGDHAGFQYDAKTKINVYAMADGYIKRVERNRPFGELKSKNYHVYIEFSCSMFASYVHVTEIAPEILEASPEFKRLDSLEEVPDNERSIWPNIPIKAGQIIGKANEWGLLGMLIADTKVTLPGFANPEKYKGEDWKMHAVPPFDYFTPELKSQLMEKNPRKKEPKGGKIDFDVPGKLSGNWFLEGTDYAGSKEKIPIYCGNQLCPYWSGHLAFVYDFVDPDQARVSFGDYSGWYPQGPYGMKGNADFAKISAEDGLVNLELVSIDDIGNECGFVTQGKPLCTRNSNNVVGIILVQMLDNNKIKVELFPGKTASEVAGFTGKAKVYER